MTWKKSMKSRLSEIFTGPPPLPTEAHDVQESETVAGRAIFNVSRKPKGARALAEPLFSIGPFDSVVEITVHPASNRGYKPGRQVDLYFVAKDDQSAFSVELKDSRGDVCIEWVPVNPKLVMVN
jgi:hypothetical protein